MWSPLQCANTRIHSSTAYQILGWTKVGYASIIAMSSIGLRSVANKHCHKAGHLNSVRISSLYERLPIILWIRIIWPFGQVWSTLKFFFPVWPAEGIAAFGVDVLFLMDHANREFMLLQRENVSERPVPWDVYSSRIWSFSTLMT